MSLVLLFRMYATDITSTDYFSQINDELDCNCCCSLLKQQCLSTQAHCRGEGWREKQYVLPDSGPP